MALDIITSNDKFNSKYIEVITYKHLDDILLPHELNPYGIKKYICYYR